MCLTKMSSTYVRPLFTVHVIRYKQRPVLCIAPRFNKPPHAMCLLLRVHADWADNHTITHTDALHWKTTVATIYRLLTESFCRIRWTKLSVSCQKDFIRDMFLQIFNFFQRRNSPQWARDSPLSRLHNRTHLHTPHSVGLLWTSDQPDAGTSIWQHTALTRDKHPCPRRDSSPRSQYASGRRPTP
jgi:hypothetical protein